LFQQKRDRDKPNLGVRLQTTAWSFLGPGLIAALLSSCAVEAPASRDTPSTLDPHGVGAQIISQEWWLFFWAGAAIVLLVTLLLCASLLRNFTRSHNSAPELNNTRGIRWIWLGGVAMPLVVLLLVFASTVRNIWALDTPPTSETLTIDVEGNRWWWKVMYPEQDITTANQLFIPIGRTVRVNLTSADVIHSFWVPQLQAKRDLIPGQANTIWLQANEPGVYRGLCSEFCGKQHAQMQFTVVALTQERYQAWLADESAPAREPNDDLARKGQQVFLSKSCVFCHTIRGTPAAGQEGPDLTHLANRTTIAAGALENNIGNLGGWIMDPQHIKPGSLMPATPLTGDELQALLAYLSKLR
jgi:cytochrome c oxidase subunit II